MFTHEIAQNWDGLKNELLGERSALTEEEVMDLVPPGMRLLLEI